MSINSGLKKAFESLGKDNNPAYVVVAIAMAKGIFRPIFTMMDKKESPETKRYTALREGLTEAIAIPTYLVCGTLAGKGAALIKEPAKAKIAQHNLRFIGVCTAALLVIPGVCSLVIKPFTNLIFNKKDKNEPAKLDITSKSPDFEPVKLPINGTAPQNYIFRKPVSIESFTNTGMKVG